MTFRRLLFVVLLILLLFVLRPSAVMNEMRRIYSQRETIWKLLTVVVFVYLLYGLYTLWQGGLPW